MYVNPLNVTIPTQTPYAFADGELHSDPTALTHFIGAERRAPRRDQASCLDRRFEKARRVAKMAERAGKERQRRARKGRGE